MLLGLTGCTLSNPPTVTAAVPEDGLGLNIGEFYSLDGVRYYGDGEYSHVEVGEASWYGSDFHGNKTANGEIYDRHAMTAAHPSLDLPSIARVTNLSNDRSVIVRINDRGPYVGDRVIDVSEQAARRLGFAADGLTDVRVEVLPEETNLAARISNGDNDILVANAGPEAGSGNQTPGRGADTMVRGGGPGWVQAAALAGDAQAMDAVRSGMVEQTTARPSAYFVEAGAFLVRENAERALSSLNDSDAARITSRLVDGTWVYRLQIGPHASENHADASLSALHQEGHTDAVIIRN